MYERSYINKLIYRIVLQEFLLTLRTNLACLCILTHDTGLVQPLIELLVQPHDRAVSSLIILLLYTRCAQYGVAQSGMFP